MASNAEEIDGFWEGRPTEKMAPGAVAEVDLVDDWLDVRNLPKVFFQVVKSYWSFDYMALRRIKCLGQTKNRQSGECYIGILEEVVWAGDKYTERDTSGRRFSYSKKNCDLTLEAAMDRLERYRLESLEQSKGQIDQWERSIKELQTSIEGQKQRDARVRAFNIRKVIGK